MATRKLKSTAGSRRHLVKVTKKAPKKFKYDEAKYLAAITTIAEQLIAMAQEDVKNNGYITVNDTIEDYAADAQCDIICTARALTS